MSTPLLQLHDVSLLKKERLILENITLEIHEKDFVTILGPNGAGKSSLLKVMAGLMHPTSGTLTQKPGVSLGYIPQKLVIDGMLPLSVSDFLELYSSKKNKEKALEEVGCIHLLHSSLGKLSGGELQRVLLAHAFLLSPDILLLDEPLQGVDVGGQETLYQLLASYQKSQGGAIVLVSHDLHMVSKISKRVICLNQHICCQGTPDIMSQDISRLFRGLSPELSSYTHHHDHKH